MIVTFWRFCPILKYSGERSSHQLMLLRLLLAPCEDKGQLLNIMRLLGSSTFTGPLLCIRHFFASVQFWLDQNPPGTLSLQGRRLFPWFLMLKFSELFRLLPSSSCLERIKMILPLSLLLSLFLFNSTPPVWPTSRTSVVFLTSCLLFSESLPRSRSLDIILCFVAVLRRTPGDQIQVDLWSAVGTYFENEDSFSIKKKKSSIPTLSSKLTAFYVRCMLLYLHPYGHPVYSSLQIILKGFWEPVTSDSDQNWHLWIQKLWDSMHTKETGNLYTQGEAQMWI